MKLFALLAATAAAVLATSANATIFQYDIAPIAGAGGLYNFRFQLESTAAPSFTSQGTIRYFPTLVSISGPGIPANTVVSTGINLGLQFNPDGSFSTTQGYLTITLINGVSAFTRFDVYNAYVLGGSNAAPVFKTGSFIMSTIPQNNGPRPADNYIVTVTNPGAVPEPAAWALMVAGFGVAGAAMRRRPRVHAAA